MDSTAEQVIKYLFCIVIILNINNECIFYLYIYFRLFYTSYPYAYPPDKPMYNYDES